MDWIELDKWDYTIAISSGTLSASLDVLFVRDLDLSEAHETGAKRTEDFLKKLARKTDYKGDINDMSGVIGHLERKFPFESDRVTNDFGGGKQHHLRDFAHHPNKLGLACSLVEQFTGTAIGTDVNGTLKLTKIPNWEQKSLGEGLWSGTFLWAMHLISDMAGSSGSAQAGKHGTGIPGPIMSFFKELSAVPGVRGLAGKDKDGHYNLSKLSQKLFNGTALGMHDEQGKIMADGQIPLDFRTGIGLMEQIVDRKQYLPVLLCEVLVSVLYSIRQFISEIEEKGIQSFEELERIDFSRILPWKSEKLKRMRLLSAATFSTIDITGAGVKAAIHCKDKSSFAREFIQGINYVGVGRLAVTAIGSAVTVKEETYESFAVLADQVETKIAKSQTAISSAQELSDAALVIAKMGTPVGYVEAVIYVYKQLSEVLEEYEIAREERIRIQQECEEKIRVLTDYRKQINSYVDEYLTDHLEVFEEAFDLMEEAVAENDSDKFISGNVKIQKKLGREDSFKSQGEFDEIMAGEDDFRL